MAMRLTATSAPVPRAVFAAPATRVNGPIELDIERDSFVMRGRLTAHPARARIVAAPDRAATGLIAAVSVRGLDITVDLARIPVGASYLQLILYGRGTQHTDLIVVRRAGAGQPGSASFSPIRLRGSGSRTIPLLEVPSAAVLTYRSAGLGLGISDARGQLHLATTARTGALPVSPGAYRSVVIVADGPWQIVIAPRRGPA